MATIKTVSVNTIAFNGRGYFWTWKNFKTFIDDNGNVTYFVNDKEVTKEQGNREYLELKNSNKHWTQSEDGKKFFKRQWAWFYRAKKKGTVKQGEYYLHEADTFKREESVREVSYEELIAGLEKSIDKYVEYIDNGRQYEQALESNRRIEEEIAKLKELIKERK